MLSSIVSNKSRGSLRNADFPFRQPVSLDDVTGALWLFHDTILVSRPGKQFLRTPT